MELTHPEGLAAVILGAICFFGSIYVLIALNTGWRFGYWVAGATFGGMFFFLSSFWLLSALGPRGEEPRWIPAAVDTESISQVQIEEQTYSAPGRFPGGDWAEAGTDGVASEEEVDPFGSSVSNCLGMAARELEEAEEPEATACRTAQELLPTQQELPRVEGMAVVMISEVEDLRFAREDGTDLGMARVVPVTRDPRYAAEQGVPEGEAVPVGEEFLIAAVRDPGDVRFPAVLYFAAAILFFGFHLWGLNRAERRKLSPVAV